MSCSLIDNVFEVSLHYSSPAHGGWGVLKAAQLIPDSYFLFASPAACGRHGALGARMEGRKERVSYLFLTEQSIVSGDYEQMLKDALEQLFSYLKKRNRVPKVMGIFVSCIDDLLGTDHESLMAELESMYPGVRFIDCHMNPTSTDTGVPPIVNIQNKLYSVLEENEVRDTGVNIIGNLQAINPDSELFEVLSQMGAEKVRHISDFKSFDEYQDMAKSQLNIVIAPSGEYACKNMNRKIGVSYEKVLTSFRPENIREGYERIAKRLGSECPDLEPYENEARKALEETRDYLDGAPVILDQEAITRPFELARCLLKAGINVKRVYSQLLIPSDKEDYKWVMEHYPDIEVRQPQNPKVTIEEKVDEECIAVGYSAGYITGALHVVDIGGQNGLYGYKGLTDLLQKIRDARDTVSDLKQILDDAVIIV